MICKQRESKGMTDLTSESGSETVYGRVGGSAIKVNVGESTFVGELWVLVSAYGPGGK